MLFNRYFPMNPNPGKAGNYFFGLVMILTAILVPIDLFLRLAAWNMNKSKGILHTLFIYEDILKVPKFLSMPLWIWGSLLSITGYHFLNY